MNQHTDEDIITDMKGTFTFSLMQIALGNLLKGTRDSRSH